MISTGDFSDGPVVKNPPSNSGNAGSVSGWGTKIPYAWRKKWQPTLVFLPGESHGWRSLEGYSPWGHRGSDMTERLHSLVHSLTHVTGQLSPQATTREACVPQQSPYIATKTSTAEKGKKENFRGKSLYTIVGHHWITLVPKPPCTLFKNYKHWDISRM